MFFQFFALILFVFGLIIAWYFVVNYECFFTSLPDLGGFLSGTVGVCWALASALLFYDSVHMQKSQLQLEKMKIMFDDFKNDIVTLKVIKEPRHADPDIPFDGFEFFEYLDGLLQNDGTATDVSFNSFIQKVLVSSKFRLIGRTLLNLLIRMDDETDIRSYFLQMFDIKLLHDVFTKIVQHIEIHPLTGTPETYYSESLLSLYRNISQRLGRLI